MCRSDKRTVHAWGLVLLLLCCVAGCARTKSSTRPAKAGQSPVIPIMVSTPPVGDGTPGRSASGSPIFANPRHSALAPAAAAIWARPARRRRRRLPWSGFPRR